MKFAVLANTFVLTAMVGIGAYQIKDAQAEQIVKAIDTEDRHCLQQNVFFEARNQSILGQVSVAWVTLNRVESSRYPDSICGVVWQKSQFSWTSDGKSDEPSDNILEQQAWEDAGMIAEQVLLDWARGVSSPVENATMFHAEYTEPYWISSYDRVAQIDSHIFYE